MVFKKKQLQDFELKQHKASMSLPVFSANSPFFLLFNQQRIYVPLQRTAFTTANLPASISSKKTKTKYMSRFVLPTYSDTVLQT